MDDLKSISSHLPVPRFSSLSAVITCGFAKAASVVVVAAANIGHPFTLEDGGPCLFKAGSSVIPDDCPASQREPTPTNPGTTPFDRVRGTPCKVNRDTGEIWCPDTLHRDHWEVYKRLKDYENQNRDREVWDSGCLRRKF